jgi:hypothetical protein
MNKGKRTKRAQRTDVHRPGAIIPADYRYLLSYAFGGQSDGCGGTLPAFNVDLLLKNEREHGRVDIGERTGGGCDICGAFYFQGDAFIHEPSGKVLRVGHTCSDKLDLAVDRSTFERERMSQVMKRERRAKKLEKIDQARGQLRADRDLARAFRSSHRIVRDILSKLLQWGSISDKQAALVKKIDADERAPKRPEAPKVNAPNGRVTVEARIVSKKVVEGDWGSAVKGLFVVSTPEGEWRAWGTIAQGILDDAHGHAVGALVLITATFEPKADDPSFAFFKRPNGKLLEMPASHPHDEKCLGCWQRAQVAERAAAIARDEQVSA